MDTGEAGVAPKRGPLTVTGLMLVPGERTIPILLERQAAGLGERPFLSVDGLNLTYRDVRDAAAASAGALAAAGVERGDRVVVMAENCWELLSLVVGCAWLGAITVPLNTSTRGPQLEHVLTNAGPRVIAAQADLLEHLDSAGARPPELERVWAIGAAGRPRALGLEVQAFPDPGDPVPPAGARPGDTAAILYTSGTTGPSKGVCCPHAQLYWYGVNTAAMVGVRSDDVLYTCLPLFHINALCTFFQALVHGARFVVGPRFSASRFWERLIEADATVTYLLGAMVSILAKGDVSPADRGHRVRVALAPATPAPLHATFRERFGIELIDAWAMTETSPVIGPAGGLQRPGSMGRLLDGFDAEVVDEEDVEVADGTPGELVIRSREPFLLSTGYWRMPEKTVESWRNLWFHTGDRVVREADGYFRFVDRIKDAIRRRGENISAWEVEQVLQSHPDVAAAAAIPVPSELGDDEVMVCVVPRKDASPDPLELVKHCEGRLAYFAIPRYIEVMDALPLTENGKVRKFALRERGITAATWDREAAGYGPVRR